VHGEVGAAPDLPRCRGDLKPERVQHDLPITGAEHALPGNVEVQVAEAIPLKALSPLAGTTNALGIMLGKRLMTVLWPTQQPLYKSSPARNGTSVRPRSAFKSATTPATFPSQAFASLPLSDSP
jgi:hypothetical protein